MQPSPQSVAAKTRRFSRWVMMVWSEGVSFGPGQMPIFSNARSSRTVFSAPSQTVKSSGLARARSGVVTKTAG